MKLNSQENTILKAMLGNKDKVWWYAKDFQHGEYFVGYEATARMSELLRYPFVIPGKDGRFRTIRIDWENQEAEEMKKVLWV